MWVRALLALMLLVAAAAAVTAAVGREPVHPAPAPGTAPGGGYTQLPGLLQDAGMQVEVALTGLPALDPGVLVVHVGPALPSGGLEAHLNAGGAVWVLTDNTSVNPWLARFGVGIDGHRVIEDGAAVEILVPFHEGFSVTPPRHLVTESGGWAALATTGLSSHVDLDGDGAVDAHEPGGPHVVAAWRSVGEGRLTVIVIPEAVMDGAPDPAGQWIQRQARQLGTTRAIIDESTQGVLPEERHATAAVRFGRYTEGLPAAWRLGGLAGSLLAAAALVMWLPPSRGLGRHSTHDPVTVPKAVTFPKENPP